MKKEKAVLLASVLCISSSLYAQKVQKDSIKTISLDNVEVISTRANQKTPVAFTNVTAKEIAHKNLGADIPYLLGNTPSVLTTSDAGAGVGYTSMRVRGTDGTRINVTVNGVPMNDSESHSLYFVNMPDLASSLRDIQVQRGAGTSTNGAGAFGASVNMQTEGVSMQPYTTLSSSYGSFNTHKETFKIGTGLLKNHWAFNARLSNIATGGYIDRASVNLNSYMLQAGYFNENTALRFVTFNGTEKTYHAWDYASKEDMKLYGRTYNPCGQYTDDAGNIRYYDNQTDNYHQQNYQVLLTQQLSENWNLHAALFYTKGAGYYEQYKTGRTLTDYGLTPFYNKDGEKIKKTDLVRRKQMENDFGGMIASIHYQNKVVDATVGGGINRYVGDHFGEITWVKNYVGALQPNERYYDNQGRKTDANIYAKATYLVAKGLNLYADLQYRYLNYQISGANDNFDWNTGAMQQLDVNDSFHFFNPKVGINWQISNQHRLFASFSVAQKEPTRNNYTDGMFTVYPKSERLNDYEMGYQFKSKRFSAGANLYYMDYKDQLVLTGQLNEIGEAMAANMPNSYRMGVELMGSALLAKNLTLHLNATFSKNRIQDFTEVIYEDGWKNPIETQLGDTPIAFSPDMLLNGSINYTLGAFDMVWQTQYVSKQYMSNSKNEQQVLDAYNVSNFSLNYHFSLPHIKRVSVGVTLYNVFDEEYENNGWAYSKYEVKAGKNVRVDQAGYAAQAGTHLMGHLSLSF